MLLKVTLGAQGVKLHGAREQWSFANGSEVSSDIVWIYFLTSYNEYDDSLFQSV